MADNVDAIICFANKSMTKTDAEWFTPQEQN